MFDNLHYFHHMAILLFKKPRICCNPSSFTGFFTYKKISIFSTSILMSVSSTAVQTIIGIDGCFSRIKLKRIHLITPLKNEKKGCGIRQDPYKGGGVFPFWLKPALTDRHSLPPLQCTWTSPSGPACGTPVPARSTAYSGLITPIRDYRLDMPCRFAPPMISCERHERICNV